MILTPMSAYSFGGQILTPEFYDKETTTVALKFEVLSYIKFFNLSFF